MNIKDKKNMDQIYKSLEELSRRVSVLEEQISVIQGLMSSYLNKDNKDNKEVVNMTEDIDDVVINMEEIVVKQEVEPLLFDLPITEQKICKKKITHRK